MDTMKSAAEKIGVPYRTVARWAAEGLIKIENHPHKPKNLVPWTEKQTHELRILAALRETLSLQELREAAEYLQKHGFNPFSKGKFIVVQGKPGKRRLIRISETKKEAVDLIGRSQGQLLLIPYTG